MVRRRRRYFETKPYPMDYDEFLDRLPRLLRVPTSTPMKRWKTGAVWSALIAAAMCILGGVVLYEQIFAWHHLRVVSVIGAALVCIGICMLYEKVQKRPL